MSIYANPTLSSSSTVAVTITNSIPSSDYCVLTAIGFVVVVYNINYFQGNYNNEFFANGQANAISSSNNSIYTFTLPINQAAYFVGHYGYHITNDGDTEYTFDNNAQNVQINIKDNPASSTQIISFNYIQF